MLGALSYLRMAGHMTIWRGHIGPAMRSDFITPANCIGCRAWVREREFTERREDQATMPFSRRRESLANGKAPADAGPVRVPAAIISASAGTEQRADQYIAEVRRILARFGTRRKIEKGASLFEPGDASRHLYIVESGTIDISFPECPEHRPIASFRSGACFLFDLGGYQVAELAAAEASEVIDIPFARLDRLCRQEMDLRLLLGQCHAFDLKSFLDVCYPARSRFRLVRTIVPEADDVGLSRDREASAGRRIAPEFMIPLTEGSGSHFAGNNKARKRNHVRRWARRTGVESRDKTNGEH